MNEIKLTENRSINEKFYTLHHASGLDIYVIPKKHSTAFAVFGTRYGSADRTFKLAGEDDYLTVPDGVAHFLEHKMFENEDGTDAFALYAPFGGNANAFTSFTSTVYLFSCTEHFDENLRVLLSFVTSPHFTEETVRKEQGIIGEEIKMYIDNPSWRVYFNLLRALYVHHPVRVDIAGTVESIAQITPEILYRCYNTFYNLHNMALCICGDVTPEQVKAVADEVLKPAPEQEILRQYPDEPDEVCRPRIEESLEVSRPLFNIGIKVTPAGDAARAAAQSGGDRHPAGYDVRPVVRVLPEKLRKRGHLRQVRQELRVDGGHRLHPVLRRGGRPGQGVRRHPRGNREAAARGLHRGGIQPREEGVLHRDAFALRFDGGRGQLLPLVPV